MRSTGSSLFDVLENPNEETRKRFVDAYRPRIVAQCRQRGIDDAEEIAQQVLLKLLKIFPSFHYDPALSFRAYVRMCTRNAINDLFRQRRRQAIRAVGGSSNRQRMQEVHDRLADAVSTVVESRLWLEAESEVRSRFEDRTWECYLAWKAWKTGERRSWGKELASKFGMNDEAVYGSARRVRDAIKEQLSMKLRQSSSENE